MTRDKYDRANTLRMGKHQSRHRGRGIHGQMLGELDARLLLHLKYSTSIAHSQTPSFVT